MLKLTKTSILFKIVEMNGYLLYRYVSWPILSFPIFALPKFALSEKSLDTTEQQTDTLRDRLKCLLRDVSVLVRIMKTFIHSDSDIQLSKNEYSG